MISNLQDVLDLVNIFPNLTTVSNETKATIIFAFCIFLFIIFDKGKTYHLLVLFQKDELKLLSILTKIRSCCSYLLSIFGWINLSLWTLLLIIRFLEPTFSSNSTTKDWKNIVVFLQNHICFIFNLTFFTCFIYIIIYFLFANPFYRTNSFFERTYKKFKYFYLNLDLSVPKLLLIIENAVFLIVTIDLNFINPLIKGKSIANTQFSTAFITVYTIILFAKWCEQSKLYNRLAIKFINFFNIKK